MKTIVKKNLWLRVLLSPLIYLATLGILLAGLIFPITALIIISIWGVVSTPILTLIANSGFEEVRPDWDDAFFVVTKSTTINHLLGVLIHIWLPIYCAIEYILYAKLKT